MWHRRGVSHVDSTLEKPNQRVIEITLIVSSKAGITLKRYWGSSLYCPQYDPARHLLPSGADMHLIGTSFYDPSIGSDRPCSSNRVVQRFISPQSSRHNTDISQPQPHRQRAPIDLRQRRMAHRLIHTDALVSALTLTRLLETRPATSCGSVRSTVLR